jgi:hypothetical protein
MGWCVCVKYCEATRRILFVLGWRVMSKLYSLSNDLKEKVLGMAGIIEH